MDFQPTPQGWKAFRQALANIPNIEDGMMWPIMGNANYHYHPPSDTKISKVSIDAKRIKVELYDNRSITVPLNWFPILTDANDQERNNYKIERDGEEIQFPLLNTEIHITQILLYKGFSEQAEFASSCIDSSELLYALALLTWRMANESGQSIGDVMQSVENKLKSWPSPSGQGSSLYQKIVIDHSYAEFNLSNEAWAAYGKVKPKDLNNISFRMDPDLVRVVEQLGERANGQSEFGIKNDLEIIEVPKGIPVRIKSYDGNEWVAEEHKVWGKNI